MTNPYAMTLATATDLSGIGRSRLYDLIAQGTIEAKKCGRRTLIVAASLERYLAGLPAAEIGATRKVA